MTERETHIKALSFPRGDNRPLIALYQLEGNRKQYPADTYNQERFSLTVPTLVFQGEDSVPLYVEAKLHLTPAELDILIGQLHGIGDWIAEAPRNYQADADFLVAQGIFDIAINGRYTWHDGRDGQMRSAEQAVDAYEAEVEPFGDLYEREVDAELQEDGLTAHTIYQKDEN